MANTWNSIDIINLQYDTSTPTIVNSVVDGTGISVDNTTPTAPIISDTFEGISVYFPTDTSITAGNNVAPWSITSYPQFYTNSNFNLTTGTYTVPSNGYYLICVSLRVSAATIQIKNNSTIIGQERTVTSAAVPSFVPPWTNVVYLTSGSTVTLTLTSTQTVIAFLNSVPYSIWSITKLF